MADQYIPKAGLNAVGNYQVSSIPYLNNVVAPVSTNSPLEIVFPSVTKFLVVKNTDTQNHPLRIGFSENGIHGVNYFTLSQNESFSGEFKVTKLYLIGGSPNVVSASIVAGLTGIDASQLPNNWSGSVGVG